MGRHGGGVEGGHRFHGGIQHSINGGFSFGGGGLAYRGDSRSHGAAGGAGFHPTPSSNRGHGAQQHLTARSTPIRGSQHVASRQPRTQQQSSLPTRPATASNWRQNKATRAGSKIPSTPAPHPKAPPPRVGLLTSTQTKGAKTWQASHTHVDVGSKPGVDHAQATIHRPTQEAPPAGLQKAFPQQKGKHSVQRSTGELASRALTPPKIDHTQPSPHTSQLRSTHQMHTTHQTHLHTRQKSTTQSSQLSARVDNIPPQSRTAPHYHQKPPRSSYPQPTVSSSPVLVIDPSQLLPHSTTSRHASKPVRQPLTYASLGFEWWVTPAAAFLASFVPAVASELLSAQRRNAFESAHSKHAYSTWRSRFGGVAFEQPARSACGKSSKRATGSQKARGRRDSTAGGTGPSAGGGEKSNTMEGLADAVLQCKVLVVSRVQGSGGHVTQAAELYRALQSRAEVVWLRREDFYGLVQSQSHVRELSAWINEKLARGGPLRQCVVLIDDVSSWGQGVAVQLTLMEHLLDSYPNFHIVYFSKERNLGQAVTSAQPGEVQVYPQEKLPGFAMAQATADAAALAAAEKAVLADSEPSAPPEPTSGTPQTSGDDDDDDQEAMQKLGEQLRDIFGMELSHVGELVGLQFQPDGTLAARHRCAEVAAKLVDVLVVTLLGLMDALRGADLQAVKQKLRSQPRGDDTSGWVLIPAKGTYSAKKGKRSLQRRRRKSRNRSDSGGLEEVVVEVAGKKEGLVRALLQRAWQDRKAGHELEWVYEDLWEVVWENWEAELAGI